MKQIILCLLLSTFTSYAKDFTNNQKVKGDIFVIDSLSIISEYSNSSIYVFGVNTRNEYPLQLARSFDEEIYEWVDRETVEMKHDEN